MDEGRSLLFTRVSMSAARCIKLLQMMGLHRLDDNPDEPNPVVPGVDEAKSWVEKEERRRLFWGAFCLDSYTSVSTGRPAMIDVNEVDYLAILQDVFIANYAAGHNPFTIIGRCVQ